MAKSKKIKGNWQSFTDDFIVNYSDERRIGAVKYGSSVDKRGKIKATIWHDKDLDGKLDKGENVIAHYKANYEVVFFELDYYSKETGAISVNERNGKFKLYHDGDKFANGKIVDMDYFFD
tara:strand:+ start:53 stop:412 length:360 start_codon:yes stop_codon:yes gene_type:complete